MFQGQTPIMYAISGRVCVPYECVRRHSGLMRCILDIGRLFISTFLIRLAQAKKISVSNGDIVRVKKKIMYE